MRALLGNPETRWHYLRVSVTQAAFVLGLAVLFTSLNDDVVASVGRQADQRMEEARSTEEGERDYQLAVLGATTQAVETGWDKAARTKFKQDLREAEQQRKLAREGARRGTAHWLVYLAALLSSLQISQWIVTALARDYHTVVSREASLRTGVPPEDEPIVPRVRLNLGWLRTKFKRRWRGTVVFILGVPVWWVISRVLPGSGAWFTLLASLWGIWWFMVFTAGKSALAWKEETAREPWFLRGWTRLFQGIPALRHYGALWRRFTQSVFSPAARVERQPWGFAGLTVARAFAVLPLVKCFLRPIIPVAAAHLLVAEPPGPQAERKGAKGALESS